MNGLIWYAVGLSCGIAIGYEEVNKKIKMRIKDLYFKNNFKFVDENGNEIPYQKIIKLFVK
jgi:hypothetical protein